MAFLKVFSALGGAAMLAACASDETVGRSETSNFHYSMTAMVEERDAHQSLAAVSMKNDLGSDPVYSARALYIIANYRH